jgi:hypothetical protein
MFPGVDGFAWDVGHIVFIGAFLTVLTVLAGAVGWSVAAAARDVRRQCVPALRWEAAFGGLPPAARVCRHTLAGVIDRQVCARSFTCGSCPDHAVLAARPIRWGLAHSPLAGVEVAPDRLYHRGHTWARREADGAWSIGLDELAERVLGTPDEVLLPPVGARLAANGVAWSARCGRDAVRVLSPLDGEVTATGSRGLGWYLKVRPSPGGPDTRHLLSGDEARAWAAGEVQRLLVALRDPAIGPALADGGRLAADLPAAAPAADWQALRGQVLLNP